MRLTNLIAAAIAACLIAAPAIARPQDEPARLPADGTTRDCLVIGDSLAVGLAAALKAQGRKCDVVAAVGLTAWQVAMRAPMRRYATAFVSAGSNNPKNPHLEDDLRTLRSYVRSPKLVWIMPYDRTAARAVSANAGETGGLVVDAAWWPTADGIHPMDYRAMARMIVK